MRQEQSSLGTVKDVGVKLECAARHEAGHLVAAAAQGLRLLPEGLMIDPSGKGFACYRKQPDENDQSRERVIVASFAGFKAEQRFREERSYAPLYELGIILGDDWFEARKVITKLSHEYMSNESRWPIQPWLESKSEHLIEQHWPAIEALATALLAKDWEQLKPLKSGGTWANENENTAKYVEGEEVVRILRQHGIAAICDPAAS